LKRHVDAQLSLRRQHNSPCCEPGEGLETEPAGLIESLRREFTTFAEADQQQLVKRQLAGQRAQRGFEKVTIDKPIQEQPGKPSIEAPIDPPA
jgi:hypothetical protein